MSTAQIYSDIEGKVAYLRLNRPEKRNALTEKMWQAIPSIVKAADTDDACRVLMVESMVDGVFTAGADIAEFETLLKDPSTREANRAAIAGGLHAIAHCTKPTIAVVDGLARGAGTGVALAADFRIASDRATFAITTSKLGLLYPYEATKRLISLVGAQRAKEMIFTAQLLSAEEALAIGLVDQVVPQNKLRETVDAFAAKLCTLSSYTIGEMKGYFQLLEDGQRFESDATIEAFRNAYGDDDFAEGLRAFKEKRTPKF